MRRCTAVKKICCVNDMPGVGKIALSAMIPILSAKGIDVTSLPTALVSNTLDFGKFDILDTTDYMDKTVDIWHDLGFRFDCISTGFMVNPRQIDIVEKLINNQKKEDLLVVVDPIMGDEGKLYNGMTDANVEIMRRLSSYADTERGKLCPMAAHVLFPMIDILRYGGKLPSDRFCCPDVDTINVFKIEKVEE